MKNLLRALPLVVFVLILLVIRLTGCQIFLPVTTTGSTGASSSGTTASSNKPTSAAATTSLSTVASTAASAADPSNLSNVKQSWYYNPPDPLNQDKPATVPAAIRQLIGRYAVLWQAPPADRKTIYLTLDEGYEYQDHTSIILNTAKIKGVPINFFITGSYLANNPALVQRMLEEGHLVANHTVNHPNLADLIEKSGETALLQEIRGLETAFRNLTGQDLAPFIRPPEGVYSERVLACLTRAGYKTVFWSFAYRDWLTDDQPDPVAAKAKILGQLHNGSIVLLHAVSATNTQILPGLIDDIRARGYDFALLK